MRRGPYVGAVVSVAGDGWAETGWYLGAHLDEHTGKRVHGVLPFRERGTENAWQGHTVWSATARPPAPLDDAFHAFAKDYDRVMGGTP